MHDQATVDGFGREWRAFDQRVLPTSVLEAMFEEYFSIFPWPDVGPDALGVDIGCGTGRWAALVAPRVRRLVCIDPSPEAVAVATENLSTHENCSVLQGTAGALPLREACFDFGYSLGVLHHTPDPEKALRDCVAAL